MKKVWMSSMLATCLAIGGVSVVGAEEVTPDNSHNGDTLKMETVVPAKQKEAGVLSAEIKPIEPIQVVRAVKVKEGTVPLTKVDEPKAETKLVKIKTIAPLTDLQEM
ncbi:hypothetical protein ACI7RC_25930 [Brevibacillus sp. B_LB10_24]|uniref:hypothetical protein n=1 Tax=Brevibacillus sp. B_LB10_24 TaxID=3380645 RepID=UPI0038BBC4BD